ncbi:MAG: hypothetical protein FJ137_13635 [Deltaproteobacteria bacterium]|nr:hypothetical protein [Deltaproteobacteria bacterium]
MTTRSRLVWVTHPRHLPKAPPGRAVVLDTAFAAAAQWRSKTKPFLDALGGRLLAFVDHHEHREAWPHYVDDPRFVLVPNRVAHACPELVTPALVERIGGLGVIDDVVAHHDFDGLLSAVKLLRGGRAPYDEADEDARAVDSPGRGHALSPRGERLSLAMEEVTVTRERAAALEFHTRLARALIDDARLDPVFDDEVDTLARAARTALDAARRVVDARGRQEADGVFVVRVDDKQDNRMRRNLLMLAEERAAIGALYEPDPQGGAWLTAATFDERLDLELVEGFEGGRSDYRFARAPKGGRELVDGLARLVASRR